MSPRLKQAGLAALVLALVAALLWGFWYVRQGRFLQSTNDATIQADQVAIAARLAGNVTRVAVADNQAVAAGALLVEIDPGDYRIRLAGTEAGIAAASAGREVIAASLAEAQAGIGSALAERDSARATLAHAAGEVVRYRPLVEQGAEAAATLAQLITDRDRAAAALAGREAALEAARRRTQGLAAQAGQAGAQVRSAQVQQQAAASDLAYTRVTAPVAGRVASRTVRAGQYVQPGTRLLTLVPGDELYVIANFKETQVGLMRAGQPATVRVDALPGIAFAGRVASVTPGTGAQFSLIPPQNATGNFTRIIQRVPVRIALTPGPAARKVLAAGMSATVEVDTRAAREELDAIAAEQQRAEPEHAAPEFSGK